MPIRQETDDKIVNMCVLGIEVCVKNIRNYREAREAKIRLGGPAEGDEGGSAGYRHTIKSLTEAIQANNVVLGDRLYDLLSRGYTITISKDEEETDGSD